MAASGPSREGGFLGRAGGWGLVEHVRPSQHPADPTLSPRKCQDWFNREAPMPGGPFWEPEAMGPSPGIKLPSLSVSCCVSTNSQIRGDPQGSPSGIRDLLGGLRRVADSVVPAWGGTKPPAVQEPEAENGPAVPLPETPGVARAAQAHSGGCSEPPSAVKDQRPPCPGLYASSAQGASQSQGADQKAHPTLASMWEAKPLMGRQP